jgi:peptide/nickel transport system permease protein
LLKRLRTDIPRVLVTLVSVTILLVFLVELMPGDPAQLVAGEFAPEEAVERTRQELRLDQSVVSRYVGWVGDALRGDLGTSVRVQPGRDVTDVIGRALPPTLFIAAFAMLIAIATAIPVGTAAALRRGSALDRMLTLSSSAALAVPSFVVAIFLVTQFAIHRSWMPATGYVAPTSDPLEGLRYTALPALALAITPAAEISRQVRGSVIDTVERDYVRTARAKGLARSRVYFKHVGKGAAAPVVTVVGLRAAAVLGGSVVIERIFAIPGFGSLAVDAVGSRDIPVIQGVVLTGAILVLFVNLIVDLVHAYLDPRIA